MAYEARVEFDRTLHLKNEGITVHVEKDGKKMGRLKIGKAGVQWLPEGASKRGPNLYWDDFVRKLEA